MRRCNILALALILAIILSACGGNAGGNDGYDATGDTGAAGSETLPESAGSSGGQMIGAYTPAATPESGEKRIYTASLIVETTNFDSAAQALAQAAESLQGYFESQHTNSAGSSRYADYTIRIPTEHYTAFLNQVGQICHVVDSSQTVEDVSEVYYDIEARLATQQTKLERLQAFLAQAEDMGDIITIESAISETELEIERLTGSLRGYDSRIQYATVILSLSEVYQLSNVEEPVTSFGQRLGAAFLSACRNFGAFLENLAVFLVRHWIVLLLLGASAAAALVVLRRRSARKNGGTSGGPS